MKLTPIIKNGNDYNWWLDDAFTDSWFDFPVTKFGKNMQRMKTDIIETEKDYVVRIDVPGYNKNDIKIHVGDNYLTVYATKEEAKKETDINGKYVHRERYLGTCSRSFYIGNVKEENIKARYEDGTLNITIPKLKANDEPRKYLKID